MAAIRPEETWAMAHWTPYVAINTHGGGELDRPDMDAEATVVTQQLSGSADPVCTLVSLLPRSEPLPGSTGDPRQQVDRMFLDWASQSPSWCVGSFNCPKRMPPGLLARGKWRPWVAYGCMCVRTQSKDELDSKVRGVLIRQITSQAGAIQHMVTTRIDGLDSSGAGTASASRRGCA